MDSSEAAITCMSSTHTHTHTHTHTQSNTLTPVNSSLLALSARHRWVLTASVLNLCFIHSLVTLKATAETNKHFREPGQRAGMVFSNHRLYAEPSERSDGL